MRTVRAARLLVLGCVAAGLAGLQGLTGLQELLCFVAPFLLVLAMLLSGRYVGEAAILARRRPAPPRPRRAGRRWTPVLERPLASLLDRSTRQLRGPPPPALT